MLEELEAEEGTIPTSALPGSSPFSDSPLPPAPGLSPFPATLISTTVPLPLPPSVPFPLVC